MSLATYRAEKGSTSMSIEGTPQLPTVASPAAALIGDPSAFGRVAEDGTVYVKTSNGEKVVGSYPGKSAEEALAYFVRKFEVLASEVVLLAARVKSGAMVPSDAMQAVDKLRKQVENLNGVGDLSALANSVDQILPLIEGGRAAHEAKKAAEAAAKAERRAGIIESKEKIIAEAESLALSESWKATGERLKTLLDEWKAAPRLDKKADADLWKRFSSSRNKFDKRRRQHFATLDAQSSAVKGTKATLVEQAEKLATSTDWVATARTFKTLMDQWKAAGRGKPSDDAKLWARFKAAQDAFFAAKNSDLERRDESQKKNLEKRNALITEIEALLPITDINSVKTKFRDLSTQWSRSGMVPRDKKNALDNRFNAVAAAVKEAEEILWRKTDPTAKARANDVVRQLSEAIANYEKQAAKSEAAGNAKKATEAREAAAARRIWLAEAEKGLAEFA